MRILGCSMTLEGALLTLGLAAEVCFTFGLAKSSFSSLVFFLVAQTFPALLLFDSV